MHNKRIYNIILCYLAFIFFLISCSSKNNITSMQNSDQCQQVYDLNHSTKTVPTINKDYTRNNKSSYMTNINEDNNTYNSKLRLLDNDNDNGDVNNGDNDNNDGDKDDDEPRSPIGGDIEYPLDLTSKTSLTLPQCNKHGVKVKEEDTFYFGTKIDWNDIKPKYKGIYEEYYNLANGGNFDDNEKEFAYKEHYHNLWKDYRMDAKYCLTQNHKRERYRDLAAILIKNCIRFEHMFVLVIYAGQYKFIKEFHKCFMPPNNEDKRRLSRFYHYNNRLKIAIEYFSMKTDECNRIDGNLKPLMSPPDVLYKPIESIMNLNLKDIIECNYYGPTILYGSMGCAYNLAGPNGMLLTFTPVPKQQPYSEKIKTFDNKINSLIAGYLRLIFEPLIIPTNRTSILYTGALYSICLPIIWRFLEIKTNNILYINEIFLPGEKSSYIAYDAALKLKNIFIIRDLDMISSEEMMPYKERGKYFSIIRKLKLLIQDIKTKTKTNEFLKKNEEYKGFIQICDFNIDIFDNTIKTDMLYYLFKFAEKFKSVEEDVIYKLFNDLIENLFRNVRKIVINKDLFTSLTNRINREVNSKLSGIDIKLVFNSYFKRSKIVSVDIDDL